MPIYMKYGKIKGNVTEEGHKEWIQLGSLQWGVGRGVSSPVGAAKDREASAPSISEIVVTKNMDTSSMYLLQESLVGKGDLVEIHMVKTGTGTLETYLEIKLEKVMISGYSTSSGGDRPSESISLNFTKFEIKYIPMKDDNTKDSPIPVGYDMATAKKV